MRAGVESASSCMRRYPRDEHTLPTTVTQVSLPRGAAAYDQRRAHPNQPEMFAGRKARTSAVTDGSLLARCLGARMSSTRATPDIVMSAARSLRQNNDISGAPKFNQSVVNRHASRTCSLVGNANPVWAM